MFKIVDVKQFKNKIEKIISQEYKVGFLGKNFDKIVDSMSESRAEKIYHWMSNVINKKIQPISISSKKAYKEWVVNELLVFRYPLKMNNNEYRVLLVKVKNAIYIEFHLGHHKYYDKVRSELNLKKSSS